MTRTDPSDPTPSRASDETFDLVERAQAGDRAALNRLLERYYPRIRRMVGIRAGGRLRSGFEVDDLVQGVLVRILSGFERFERRSDALFIHWVSRLASNEVCDQGRRQVDRSLGDDEGELLELVSEESRGVLSRLGRSEEEALVDECIGTLAPDHQEVLLLREYAGASWAEIAEVLDRPSVGACQQLHQRARSALAEIVARRGLRSTD